MLFHTPFDFLLSADRKLKRTITITYDIIAIALSLYLAIALRLNVYVFELHVPEVLSLVSTIVVTIVCFINLGMYRAVLRYMMLPALGTIFFAVFLSAMTLALSGFFFHTFIPRSVPFIYAGLAILTLGGPRVLIRSVYDQVFKRKKPNVFIYGAGAAGRDLASALIQGTEFHPVALLDDDPEKVGQIFYGVRVYHSSEFDDLKGLYSPVKVLLAVNNIGKGERLRLLEKVSHWPVEILSVPSVEDIAMGKAESTEVKELDVADLLGREAVEPDMSLMARNIEGENVMVTGGGGSIGSELCRQILRLKPHSLIIFELNEYNLYKIDQELNNIKERLKLNVSVVSVLGSVQRQNRLEKAMLANKVNTVFHAAAYKHVPLVESNIVEGVRNNVFGTLYCAQAAIKCNVEHFTLISTDKAVRPTNIMGATKRMAELVLQALAHKQSTTTFTMVRFGNVLGSSGSVVPLFKEQIRRGGPVTVTHPDIIRYFMLIPEAAQLVIQAGSMGNNGQVFVLDMGEPVKILDLAKRMIHLMGMREHIEECGQEGDITVKFTGLRSGEKLYEELLIGDNVEGSGHQKIMTAKEQMLVWEDMKALLKELDVCCHNFDESSIIQILLNAPTGYKPTEELPDKLRSK